MDAVQITLFGRLAVRRGGQPVELPAKAAELLVYLLLHRGRPQTREALATAPWAEADAVQGKKYLRKALQQLQQLLAGGEPGATPLLALDQCWVATHPAALHDITKLEGIRDKVLELAPVRQRWRCNDYEDLGFIAQEVEALLPEIVCASTVEGAAFAVATLTADHADHRKEQYN